MVADRVNVFSQLLAIDPAVDVLRDLGRLHFDLAGFPTPEFAAAMAGERLAEVGDPPGSLLNALRANTERLFPALSGRR